MPRTIAPAQKAIGSHWPTLRDPLWPTSPAWPRAIEWAAAIEKLEQQQASAAVPQNAVPAPENAEAAPQNGDFDPGNDVIVSPETEAVHEAATSPLNDRAEPTPAQKQAGNYKLGHIRVAGMDVSIENPQGSVRRGTDASGKAWETPMRHHYGYFKGTTAADGDKLDVFIKPGTPQDFKGQVFVVDQVDPGTGRFDEHKVILGAKDAGEAEAIYRSNYDANWKGMGGITALPLPAFKAWAASGRLKEPLGEIASQEAPQVEATAPAQAAAPDARAAGGGAAPEADAGGGAAGPGAGGQPSTVAFTIFTGKSALYDGYGANIGSISEGTRRQLMIDPGGGYFWGDWRQESQRDVGAVAGGQDRTFTPASFATQKEAREAAAATPTNKRQAGGQPAAIAQPVQQQQAKPDPDEQRRAHQEAEGKRREKAARLRAAATEKNPLMAFLANHGVSLQLAGEFAPGTAERRKAIVPGYGPIFRRAGLNIDELAQRAAEAGFLPVGSDDANALYEQIIPMPPKDDGEKRYIAIPYPLGLHVIPNTGRVMTELSLNGGKDLGKRAFNAAGEITGAFNPLGGGNVFTADGALKTIAPTVVDPVIELGANRNFAGNPIEKASPRGETDNRPGYQRAKETTMRSASGQVYLGISKAINALTGGTAYEAGLASPTPERVRYIAQTVGGGVLRELEKSVDAAVRAMHGEKSKMSAIPVVGRFYGEVDSDQVQQSRYFEQGRKLDALQSSLKAAEKAGDGEAMARMLQEHPEAIMIKAHDKVARELQKLNKLAVSTVEDREAIKAIDQARVEQMKALNAAMKDLEEASGKLTLGQRLRGAVKPAEVATAP